MTPMDPPITPVLTTSWMGRTGSTLLMSALGEFPEVCHRRVPPFEDRPFTYLVRGVESMCGLALVPPLDPSSWRWRLVDWLRRSAVSGQVRLGMNAITFGELPKPPPSIQSLIKEGPGPGWNARALEGLWRATAGDLVQDRANRRPGADLTKVRYLAEKTNPEVVRVAQALMPEVRVIYRLRDPRDVWLSVQAFNKKRGSGSFYRDLFRSEAAYLDWFLVSAQAYMQHLNALDEKGQGLIIRYDDLVLRYSAVLEQLADYLGLDLPEASRGEVVDQGTHGTSSSPAASIGRWRHEMPARLVDQFDEVLGPQLDGAFGPQLGV